MPIVLAAILSILGMLAAGFLAIMIPMAIGVWISMREDN